MSELVDLPRGEGYRLDSGGANEITTRAPTNVILFAGTAESGKTTLLATLYLLFQKGPFASFSFAGSRTLVGFEQRVHNARLASNLSKPRTERSKVSELLHLRVRKEDRSIPAQELLLCDLWGEDTETRRIPLRAASDSRSFDAQIHSFSWWTERLARLTLGSWPGDPMHCSPIFLTAGC
jgi:hypothetical protein